MSNMTANDEFVELSNEQLRKALENLQSHLPQGATEYAVLHRNQEVMKLLHTFNDVKDAAQSVLGALAHIQGLSIKVVHLTYNLPLHE